MFYESNSCGQRQLRKQGDDRLFASAALILMTSVTIVGACHADTTSKPKSDKSCDIAAAVVDPGDPWPFPKSWYLSPEQSAKVMVGMTPPADDEQDLRELETAADLAQSTPNCQRALGEQKYTNFAAFFGIDAAGKELLTAKEIEIWLPLMARIRVEQDIITWPYKDTTDAHAIHRDRPFVAYQTPPHSLHVCPGTKGIADPAHVTPEEASEYQKSHGMSFPSAHASESEAQARVLGAIYPSKKQRLLERARQIGMDREILRVHFPSDVSVGSTIGDRIADELLNSPRFLADLDAIKVCKHAGE